MFLRLIRPKPQDVLLQKDRFVLPVRQIQGAVGIQIQNLPTVQQKVFHRGFRDTGRRFRPGFLQKQREASNGIGPPRISDPSPIGTVLDKLRHPVRNPGLRELITLCFAAGQLRLTEYIVPQIRDHHRLRRVDEVKQNPCRCRGYGERGTDPDQPGKAAPSLSGLLRRCLRFFLRRLRRAGRGGLDLCSADKAIARAVRQRTSAVSANHAI